MNYTNKKSQEEEKPQQPDKKHEIPQQAGPPQDQAGEPLATNQPGVFSDPTDLEIASEQIVTIYDDIKPETDLTNKYITKIIIPLTPEGESIDLENIIFPLLPYSINANIHNTLQEAFLTKREISSHNLPVYIVPVQIEGNVAQSLFSVTQDGKWFQILIGNFSTKKSTRETLRFMVEKLPNYHLEIMKYDYTVECGRFLVKEEAEKLIDELIENGFSPYSHTYLTQNEITIWRVMTGCFFSSRGAQAQKDQLEKKGYTGKIVKR